MDRFIRELRHKPLSLVDDGIDVDPSSSEPRPSPRVAPTQAGAFAQVTAEAFAPVTAEAFAPVTAEPRGKTPPQREPATEGRRGPRPQIISYFIDYFVVFVTVASVYFSYRMVSYSTEVSVPPPTSLLEQVGQSEQGALGGAAFALPFIDLAQAHYGIVSLVCISVLFVVYKLLHGILAIPSVGERWCAHRQSHREAR